MKQIIYVLIGGGVLTSCFPTSMITTPEPVKEKVITYDYSPPESSGADTVTTSLILLDPKYAEELEAYSQPMFTKFIKSMGDDFEELLVAKGYTLRGPYATYDEIVYSDKSETDLMLETEIKFDYEWDSDAVKYTRHVSLQGVTTGYTYWIEGNLHLGGKINLVIKESLTQEKLWVKSIPLTSKSIHILTDRYRVNNASEANAALSKDVQYKNAVYEALDEYYQNALQTAWNHLDPRELSPLRKQVQELRKKKGY